MCFIIPLDESLLIVETVVLQTVLGDLGVDRPSYSSYGMMHIYLWMKLSSTDLCTCLIWYNYVTAVNLLIIIPSVASLAFPSWSNCSCKMNYERCSLGALSSIIQIRSIDPIMLLNYAKRSKMSRKLGSCWELILLGFLFLLYGNFIEKWGRDQWDAC